jgi:hypothetical protein
MGLFDNFKKAEVRSLENPNAPVSAENFLHIMGWGDFQSSAGVTVNIDNALGGHCQNNPPCPTAC